jgi:hypothetical protein
VTPMNLHLITHSPNIETMIATSMLTTTSGAMPSTLYNRLLAKPEKVADIVGRIEVQHGNILEHNRLVWKLEASKDEVLSIMLGSRFFNITEAGKDKWVVSSNLRTLVEYHQTHRDGFSELLVESIKEAAPQVYQFIRRTTR